eukprot:10516452-Alexandrium_andersonii.AAC.1
MGWASHTLVAAAIRAQALDAHLGGEWNVLPQRSTYAAAHRTTRVLAGGIERRSAASAGDARCSICQCPEPARGWSRGHKGSEQIGLCRPCRGAALWADGGRALPPQLSEEDVGE